MLLQIFVYTNLNIPVIHKCSQCNVHSATPDGDKATDDVWRQNHSQPKQANHLMQTSYIFTQLLLYIFVIVKLCVLTSLSLFQSVKSPIFTRSWDGTGAGARRGGAWTFKLDSWTRTRVIHITFCRLSVSSCVFVLKTVTSCVSSSRHFLREGHAAVSSR